MPKLVIYVVNCHLLFCANVCMLHDIVLADYC